MIIVIRDEKRFSSLDGSVCEWVFLEKQATFTTWRKPYFYVTFSLLYVVFDSVPHNGLLLFDLCCFLFVCILAYSIKICILFTLYSEWVHFSQFSYLHNCTRKNKYYQNIFFLSFAVLSVATIGQFTLRESKDAATCKNDS